MDYSLLMFIVFDFGNNMDKPSEQFCKADDSEEEGRSLIEESKLPIPNGISSHVQNLVDENGYPYKRFIYFGVIDYLTSFSFMKRFEEQWKGTFSKNVSCVAPEKYGKRFVDFMEKVIGGNV